MDEPQFLERKVTKTLLKALGVAAVAAGILVGDSIVYAKKGAAAPAPPFTVTQVTPAPGGKDLPLDLLLTATLSDDADPTTVTEGSVDLRDAADLQVPCQVSYDPLTRTVRAQPKVALLQGTTYLATVQGVKTVARGKGAKAVSQTLTPYTWSFTTKVVTTPPPPPPPPDPEVPELKVVEVVPNDDSFVVRFERFVGAVDYRVYPVDHAHAKKYSGGNDRVEWNGLTDGQSFVVEAVDKLGPYQYFDGSIPHHALYSINGQGDPANVPTVLARSQPFTVFSQPHPFRSDPGLIFFDRYSDGAIYTQVPMDTVIDPRYGYVTQQYGEWIDSQGTWIIRGVDVDLKHTKVFQHGGHIMDIVRDGGTEGTAQPPRTQYGELFFTTQREFDLTEGKIVHFTFEVDGHYPTNRRWWNTWITAPGDLPLHPFTRTYDPDYHPTVKRLPTLQWQISTAHMLHLWRDDYPAGNVAITRQENGAGTDSFNWCQRSGIWAPGEVLGGGLLRKLNGDIWNGTSAKISDGEDVLDLRRRYDLIFSQNRVQIWEDGRLCRDAAIDLPLPRAVVHFGHGVYHSALEEQELRTYKPEAQYYLNHAPAHDERHWDNVGARYVPAFPAPDDPANTGITWPN